MQPRLLGPTQLAEAAFPGGQGDRTDVAQSVSHKDGVLDMKVVGPCLGNNLAPAVQPVSSTYYAASVAAKSC